MPTIAVVGLYVVLVLASLVVLTAIGVVGFIMWVIYGSEKNSMRDIELEYPSDETKFVEDVEYWMREEIQDNGGEYDQ